MEANFNKQLQQQKHTSAQNKLAASSLFLMAASYIILMVIYGALLIMPEGLAEAEKLAFVGDNAILINATYVIGYVLFACYLLLANIVMKSFIASESPLLGKITHAFGLIWVVILSATGLIAITSTNLIAAGSLETDTALVYYHASNLLTDSLGGGIEFIGGMWVLLIGVFGWQTHSFSRGFSFFSLVKGFIGIVTLICPDTMLRVAFGLTGVVWFIWFAFVMLGLNKNSIKAERAALA